MVDAEKVYSIEEAVSLVKQFPAPKFDQTVTITFKMGNQKSQKKECYISRRNYQLEFA